MSALTGDVESIEADVVEAMDAEKALLSAAVAARAWCERGTSDQQQGSVVVQKMMNAASWISRSRRHRQLPPVSLAEMAKKFSEPADTWLPILVPVLLVEDGRPTSECEDLADEAGWSPSDEVEQGVIKKAMVNIRGRSDESEIYTRFRRSLVENPIADHMQAVATALPVGLDLAQVYERVLVTARVRIDGSEYFFPCPRCRWPMWVEGERVSCRRSDACLSAGARFSLRNSVLLSLGSFPAPAPVAVDGMVALRPGVWRYTVLPGLEELSLEAKLRGIEGIEIELWPFVDAYDLDVRRGGRRWRIDVKDYGSAWLLAKHLKRRPASEETWIVVPQSKRGQVQQLKRLVKPGTGYRFTDSATIVRSVRAAM